MKKWEWKEGGIKEIQEDIYRITYIIKKYLENKFIGFKKEYGVVIQSKINKLKDMLIRGNYKKLRRILRIRRMIEEKIRGEVNEEIKQLEYLKEMRKKKQT